MTPILCDKYSLSKFSFAFNINGHPSTGDSSPATPSTHSGRRASQRRESSRQSRGDRGDNVSLHHKTLPDTTEESIQIRSPYLNARSTALFQSQRAPSGVTGADSRNFQPIRPIKGANGTRPSRPEREVSCVRTSQISRRSYI